MGDDSLGFQPRGKISMGSGIWAVESFRDSILRIVLSYYDACGLRKFVELNLN